MKFIPCVHLVLKLRMSGAVFFLSFVPSWHGQEELYTYFTYTCTNLSKFISLV